MQKLVLRETLGLLVVLNADAVPAFTARLHFMAEDVGPTFVGDEWSDPELMAFLDATLMKQLGNNYAQYKTELAPRQVLDRLETKGFKLVAMTGVGQTCIWTLHKEADSDIGSEDLDSSKCMDISSINELRSLSNTEQKSN